ncbi:MAG: hypothetical protein IKJ57_01845, partial [Oscillospiraceae bacterium]|nr:hypothetical protein [Oscillospiraceae bacterium]
MKRLLSLLLAIIMVMNLGIAAFAAGSPTLEFEGATFTQKGQTKEVKLTAKNFGRITVLQFGIEYDKTKLEVVNVEVNPNLAEYRVNVNIPGEIYVVWDDLSPKSISGDLVTIIFRSVSEKAGETEIGFIEGEDLIFANENFEDISSDVVVAGNGKIVFDYPRPTLEFEGATFTQKGQTKEVKLTAKNFSKITALYLALEYDESKLEVENVEVNANLAAPTVNTAISGEIYVVWDALSSSQINGDLVTITFKSITQKAGETEIGFIEGEDIVFAGEDFSEIPFSDIAISGNGKIVFDYPKPTLEFEGATFTQKGQTKEVKLTAKNFEKITMAQFAFGYDETKLEVVNVEIHPNLMSPTVNFDIPGEIYVCWDGLSAADMNGELAVITFKAIADELGSTEIDFLEGEELIFAGEDYLEIDNVVIPNEPCKAEIDYVHVHTWNDWTVTKDPTCTEPGERYHTCTAYKGTCGEVATEEIPALGHDWDEGVVTTEPTCDEDGVRTHTCQRANCPVGTKTSVEPKLGHDWSEWEETVAPDCEEYGEATRYCKRDRQHIETRPVDPLGHDWGEWEETKAPDCTNPGEKVHVCGVCGEEETGTIPALGHDWSAVSYEWSEGGKVCTAERECANDASHNEKVTAKVTEKVIKEATCTEPGETEYTAKFECDWASERKTVKADIPALGHDWGEAEYEWSKDGKSCTAERICKNDAQHTEEVKAEVSGKEVKA